MVIDETADDLDAISTFIGNLPDEIRVAIAEGMLSCTVTWEEVTRDEDDSPIIKPRLVLTATGGNDERRTDTN